jgi:hypothetical protein
MMRRLGLGLLAIMLLSAPARADAIDGEWCSGDGRRMTIDGPRIVSPGGIETQGNYHRHSFAYEIPAGDPQAGVQVIMQLLNEEQVRVTEIAKGVPGDPRIWRRCQVTS